MVRYDPYTDSFIEKTTKEITATINLDAIPKDVIQINEVVEVSDESIEKIADAVVRKLADRKTEPQIVEQVKADIEKRSSWSKTYEEMCKTEPQTEDKCKGCIYENGDSLMACVSCQGKVPYDGYEWDEPQTERGE